MQKAGVSEKPGRKWRRLPIPRERMTAMLYARLMLMRGGQQRLSHEDWMYLGMIYRPRAKRPEMWVRRFVKSQKGSEMVAEELTRILAQHGITPEEVVRQYCELQKKADEKGDLRLYKSVTDQFAKMLGIDKPMAPDASHALQAHVVQVIQQAGEILQHHLPPPQEKVATETFDLNRSVPVQIELSPGGEYDLSDEA